MIKRARWEHSAFTDMKLSSFNGEAAKKITGVDTFVQGTVVQGPLCPRDISPRGLLPKETLVQGDFCPR